MTLTYKYALKGKRARRVLRRMAWGVNQAWNFCAETQRGALRRWKEGSSAGWPTAYTLAILAIGLSVQPRADGSRAIRIDAARSDR